MGTQYDWAPGFRLEMETAKIISDQALAGVNFKSRTASWYAHTLSERIVNVDKKLIPLLPMMMNKGTSYKKPFLLSGKFAKWPGLYAESVGLKREEVGGPFTAVWYTPFDPSKVAKVKDVMLEHGWIPAKWNFKKQLFDVWAIQRRLKRRTFSEWIRLLPRDEAEHYRELADGFLEKQFRNRSPNYRRAVVRAMGIDPETRPNIGVIKKALFMTQYWVTSPKINPDKDRWLDGGDHLVGGLLSQRMQFSHRRSLLQGLLKVVRPDGKIPAEANSCATPTARMKHRKVVNIPSSGSFFGEECRGLFIADTNEGSEPFLVPREREGKDGKMIPYNVLIPRNSDVFVGGDAAGLELRVLTHYLVKVCSELLRDATERNDRIGMQRYQEALDSAYVYRETLLEADIHSHNQKLAGLPTRGKAKNFI